MELNDILSSDRTFTDVEGASKKRVLENAATLIASENPEFEVGQLFDNLIARERLGSTAIGKGVAIPHSRINSCKQAKGYLMRLAQPVDFDAIDNEPVDLLFILLVPPETNEEHLKLLSQAAERFSNALLREKLRESLNHQQLYDNFANFE